MSSLLSFAEFYLTEDVLYLSLHSTAGKDRQMREEFPITFSYTFKYANTANLQHVAF